MKKGYYNARGHENTANETALAEEARKAAEHGMTYGQYRAKEEAKRVKIVRKWPKPETKKEKEDETC